MKDLNKSIQYLIFTLHLLLCRLHWEMTYVRSRKFNITKMISQVVVEIDLDSSFSLVVRAIERLIFDTLLTMAIFLISF